MGWSELGYGSDNRPAADTSSACGHFSRLMDFHVLRTAQGWTLISHVRAELCFLETMFHFHQLGPRNLENEMHHDL